MSDIKTRLIAALTKDYANDWYKDSVRANPAKAAESTVGDMDDAECIKFAKAVGLSF